MDVPSDVERSWTAVVGAEDPLVALAAMPQLREALTGWEAALARVALADGASWATIGQALGTSRQAAWERLRPVIAAAIEVDRRQVEEQRSSAAKRGRAHERS